MEQVRAEADEDQSYLAREYFLEYQNAQDQRRVFEYFPVKSSINMLARRTEERPVCGTWLKKQIELKQHMTADDDDCFLEAPSTMGRVDMGRVCAWIRIKTDVRAELLV